MLHEGGFRIAREADEALQFITGDGRTIPRCGYRLEDFVDDEIGSDADLDTSREGFCPTAVQPDVERVEVRESAAVYRLRI
jgi:hypothetical protein